MRGSRRAYARRKAATHMDLPCTISHGASVVWTGYCFYAETEASSGQLSEPDPIEADISAYESYNIWLRKGPLLSVIRTGDIVAILDPAGTQTLTISAIQGEGSAGVASQLRGVRQQTSTPYEAIAFVRIDPDTGEETELGPYDVQVVLESGIPTNMGQAVLGGSTPYLLGYLIFADRSTDVKAGDRFSYNGKWGEVTGVPAIANDRLEVRMRLAAAGAA